MFVACSHVKSILIRSTQFFVDQIYSNNQHQSSNQPLLAGYELELIRGVGADASEKRLLQRRNSSEEITTGAEGRSVGAVGGLEPVASDGMLMDVYHYMSCNMMYCLNFNMLM